MRNKEEQEEEKQEQEQCQEYPPVACILYFLSQHAFCINSDRRIKNNKCSSVLQFSEFSDQYSQMAHIC